MTVLPQDLARTLVSRQRRRRQALAERAQQLNDDLAAEMASFLRTRSSARAWLVGSLARRELLEHSDVDVAIAGVSPGEAVELAVTLTDRMGVSVDVLRVEDLQPAARHRVEAEGVSLDVP